jgi:dTDP-4-dehydrorhamnose reductase
MKILVTGSNGLVGNALDRVLSRSEHKHINTARSLGGISSEILDITDYDSVEGVMKKFLPDVVINSAAMANVDKCEEEREKCWSVNVDGVKNLVEACDKYGSHLVHISTDYIFDGKKEGGIYLEDDVPSPQGVYAESKLAGEDIILSSGISSSILRTILVYGIHERHNIVTFVKDSLERGEQVSLVSDQVRMPTFVDDLAGACLSAAEKKAGGVFNISGSEHMSYLDIGNTIAEHLSLDKSLIRHVKTSDLRQLAQRPLVTGFDLSRSRKILNFSPTPFRDSLDFIFS